jgi:uncharacterized protein
VIAALAVAVGAVAQAITGLGFSLVSAPFLVASLGRAEGVRLNLALAAVLNAGLLASEYRSARWRTALHLFVPALVATPVLALALHHVNGKVLSIAAGSLTIISAALLAKGARIRRAGARAGAAMAGVVSAAMNLVGGIGGPPIAMYTVNAGWPTASVRPTLQLFFLGLNVIGVIALGLPQAHATAWLGLAVGWVVGLVVARRVPDRAARPAILGVAAVGGVVAILRAKG